MATQASERGFQALGRRLFGFLGHLGAIAVGFVLMVVGIGLGVTMIMIPVAIPVGMFGFGMFLWGSSRAVSGRRSYDPPTTSSPVSGSPSGPGLTRTTRLPSA